MSILDMLESIIEKAASFFDTLLFLWVAFLAIIFCFGIWDTRKGDKKR